MGKSSVKVVREWQKRNPEKVKIYKKRWHQKHPWYRPFSNAKIRCKHSKSYRKKEIKFFLTSGNVRYLWFRDKAYLLKRPSLDRIDNNGDYKLPNCRFIEQSENSSRGNKGIKKPWVSKANKKRYKD